MSQQTILQSLLAIKAFESYKLQKTRTLEAQEGRFAGKDLHSLDALVEELRAEA